MAEVLGSEAAGKVKGKVRSMEMSMPVPAGYIWAPPVSFCQFLVGFFLKGCLGVVFFSSFLGFFCLGVLVVCWSATWCVLLKCFLGDWF